MSGKYVPPVKSTDTDAKLSLSFTPLVTCSSRCALSLKDGLPLIFITDEVFLVTVRRRSCDVGHRRGYLLMGLLSPILRHF